MNPKVTTLLTKEKQWQKEMQKLRGIILDCGLTEQIKWGQPCYTLNGKNIVLIHGFKEYCAILFMKGALLEDKQGLLIQQTKNVQAGRHIRFTNVREIEKLSPVLKSYIYQAMDIEKAGLKIALKQTSDYEVPEEFQKRLDASAKLRKAFESLTPGRQRGYILYFSQAKQSKTREARIEKYIPQILEGRGLQD